MNSSRTSKRRTARQLSIGLTAAGVLALGLAVPAFAVGTNAVTGVPAFINLANQGTVVISGTATTAVKVVRVALDDGQNAIFDIPTTLVDTSTGKTWQVSVNASSLADGPVAVFANFDGKCVQVSCSADKTVEKDTDAPEVPTASPDGPATFSAAHEVLIESIGDQARTHFTSGTPAAAPTASSPVVPVPYTVRTTQQVKAIAFDLAGNASPIMVMDYTVTADADAAAAAAAAARAKAAADAAAADAAAKAQVAAAAAAAAARAKAAADVAAADAAAKAQVAAAADAAAAANAAGAADAAAKARVAAVAKAAADAAAADAAAKARVAAVAKAAADAAAADAAAKARVAAAAAAKVAAAAPTVIARTPALKGSGVSRTGNITATFSKGVTGVTGRSFTLRTRAGKAVAARVTYNSRTRVATLNPTRTLAADTTYVATLSNGVKAGKALATTRWSFITGPRPTVKVRTPGANAAKVARSANVTVRFSERVVGVSGSSVLLMAVDGRRVAAVVSYNARTGVATLNPTSALAAGTRYTVVLGSTIKDRSGNALTAARWGFTTGR